MKMTSEICRFLEWDSEFFGLRIARVNLDVLRPADLPRIRQYCAAERIDGLYLLARADDPETHHAAEESRFRLVDIRVTLERGRPNAVPGSAPLVRPAATSDLPALREIAR